MRRAGNAVLRFWPAMLSAAVLLAGKVVAQVPVPPATPVPAATPQPLICRSSIATGSLIARHRQCLTKAQWRYVDDQHEAEARRYVGDGTTRQGCNGPAC